VRGVSVAKYGIADFRYDAGGRTAVWTLSQPIGADRVVFELDKAKFGGQAQRLNVLPGDVNGDGAVLADDFSDVKRRFFTSTTNRGSGNTGYSALSDVNGSGSILADDYSEVKRRFFTKLPGADPAPAAVTPATAALRVAGATRDLFSPGRVLA
jgi:dockerin type I repeat protein